MSAAWSEVKADTGPAWKRRVVRYLIGAVTALALGYSLGWAFARLSRPVPPQGALTPPPPVFNAGRTGTPSSAATGGTLRSSGVTAPRADHE
jgi:hypothetical protein